MLLELDELLSLELLELDELLSLELLELDELLSLELLELDELELDELLQLEMLGIVQVDSEFSELQLDLEVVEPQIGIIIALVLEHSELELLPFIGTIIVLELLDPELLDLLEHSELLDSLEQDFFFLSQQIGITISSVVLPTTGTEMVHVLLELHLSSHPTIALDFFPDLITSGNFSF